MSFQKLSRLNRKLLPRSTAEKSKPHFFQLLSLAPAFNSLVEKLLLQRQQDLLFSLLAGAYRAIISDQVSEI
jgi:hypothetical protein